MAKFNPGRTQPVLWSYLEELILLMTGCASEKGNIELRMSTGLIQGLDEEEALWRWVQWPPTRVCPAAEGHFQRTGLGLLCLCAVISVSVPSTPTTSPTSSVCRRTQLSSAIKPGVTGVGQRGPRCVWAVCSQAHPLRTVPRRSSGTYQAIDITATGGRSHQ